MATLSEAEIEKLFSGAPQYFARSEGHYTGAPHPSVAFPWDEKLEIRDLTDHTQIEDRAWGCVTAWPHITRDVQGDRSAAKKESEEKRRAHFYPRCRERPNMLSMGGLEKGSMGYQAALELGVADALQDEQWGFENIGARTPEVVEQRQKMLTSKDGLRHMEESSIMEQLIKNGQRYVEKHPRERRVSSELYNELFLQILHPPTKVLDHRDPYSLSVQISALVKVLAAPNMWIDFSHVEWRIRLGQLLWGYPSEVEDAIDDGASTKTSDSAGELLEERYWLLLQILLSCELLVRLDAITEGEELGMESIRPSEIHRFEKDANKSVKWSLHLARAWLESIEVVKTEPTEQQSPEPTGWLATLTKRMSMTREPQGHHSNSHQHRGPFYAIKGKHVQRQVDGLTHFATKLRWPEAESYASRISDSCRGVAEGITPLASPASRADSHRSSYFGGPKDHTKHGPMPSRRRKIAAALHPSGWLSKSYVSGLMLPGEGLSHFLMATLLENDQEAMERLGTMANLCGGFVYSGKSFWSTACIVGRVLAAGKGSAECMGWISSDIIPEGLADGWVNIKVEETAEDAHYVDKKARIWNKQPIERESRVLGDADPFSVLPADFIIPFENIYKDKAPPDIRIELKGLKLLGSADSIRTTSSVDQTPLTDSSQSPEIHTYPAAINFAVTQTESLEVKEYTYTLTKDINFVTAHPCAPSQHVKIFKSPSSPTIQQVDLSGFDNAGKTASVVGHPLHKYYTYTALHLSELLAKHDFSLEALLGEYSSTARRPSLPTSNRAAKVLVIDCFTGFQSLPQEHEIPLSPTVSRTDSYSSANFSRSPLPSETENAEDGILDGAGATTYESASKKMHSETRRRQFGSDVEILVRAFCAEKGWNALISRRRRGCLACAIREAGALGWKVIIRVD
ncbi:hypothetical protein B0T17DRAFT_497254 [Bombardia bombarda]|uniref:Helicase-like protein n=1 Tax=Bombardia bombarda TaxID=252184 RepID=A0AA39WI03_9PEZI|nr:hypothetical protein B0T17DRAFT_497254 [Bombardia bombarda]